MAENTQFVALLEKETEHVKVLLPEYLDLDRFMALARTVGQNYQLAECTPSSLVNCIVSAAERGLEIGGPSKHCAIVKFKKTAVLIVQWQGKAFLWSRAGAITKLKADVVYEGDEFELESGDQDRIIHRPDYKADRDPKWLNSIDNIVGAYAIAWLPDGEKTHAFVSRSQLKRTMEAVKKKNEGSLGFGWQDWLPEMCRKTAVHRLDGFLQAPANASKAQSDAWMRSIKTEDERVSVDVDKLRQAEAANEDIKDPPSRKAESVEVVKDKPEPKSDAGEPISADEEALITAAAGKKGIRHSALFKLIGKAGIEAEDYDQIKKGQVAQVLKVIEEA